MLHHSVVVADGIRNRDDALVQITDRSAMLSGDQELELQGEITQAAKQLDSAYADYPSTREIFSVTMEMATLVMPGRAAFEATAEPEVVKESGAGFKRTFPTEE